LYESVSSYRRSSSSKQTELAPCHHIHSMYVIESVMKAMAVAIIEMLKPSLSVTNIHP
jgi:hypothetical protein